MSWIQFHESTRTLIYCVAVVALAATGLWFGVHNNTAEAKATVALNNTVPAATFAANAGTLGPIPDNNPATPRDVTFTVSGISGAPTNVEVSHTYSPIHSWVGDINATLIAPNGTSFVIYGRTGQTGASAGDSSDLGGPYNFKDSAAGTNWWAAAFTAGAAVAIPAGDYRTTQAGPQPVTGTSPVTNLSAAFAGVANPNGTWTLRFTDNAGGDTGTISAATLTIDSVAIVADGPNDVTGDGKSDFIIVRADGPPLSEFMGANDSIGKDKVGNMQRREQEKADSLIPQVGIGWWTANGATQAPIGRTGFGQDTDFFLTGDYDNDGKDDLTVWSPGAATVAAFKIFQSSNNTVLTIPYGQTGDDPTIGGDFNDDGRQDLSVYRDGTPGSPQSTFFWSSVTTPTAVNYIPWGTDGDVAYTLDYDGDGRSDAAIQRNGGGGRGDHYIRQSSNGALVFVIYGLSSDFVVPGDYDGDGRDDIAVSRNANFGAGTFKYFWILESDGGGIPNTPQQWGIPGDFICQGDWDGDGITDIGVWRSNVDPTMNFFYVRRSSNGSLQQFEWGASGDYPVNNWDVH